MKFLYILEGGSVWQASAPNDGDLRLAAEGVLDIFKFENSQFYFYNGNGWEPVEDAANDSDDEQA